MEWIIDIAKQLKDPAMVVLIVCVGVLAKLLLLKEKANMAFAEAVSASNVLLSRITTLVETMAFRRGNDKND